MKEVKKSALEDLRKGFEEDRRRLAKVLMKESKRSAKISKQFD